MTFDEDLFEAVRRQAPPGVHFEDEEVANALTKALDDLWLGPRSWGSIVEQAADRVLRARLPKPPPTLGFWRQVAMRLGWSQ